MRVNGVEITELEGGGYRLRDVDGTGLDLVGAIGVAAVPVEAIRKRGVVGLDGVIYVVRPYTWAGHTLSPGMAAAVAGLADPANSYSAGGPEHAWMKTIEELLRELGGVLRYLENKASLVAPQRSPQYRLSAERAERLKSEIEDLGLKRDQIELALKLEHLGIAERIAAVEAVIPRD